MSTLPLPSANKPWWSRSKSRDGSMLRSNSSHSSLSHDSKASTAGGSSKHRETSGSRFNTFVASAMGKKSKKPTLTIQDPPSPYVTSPSSVSSFSPTSTAVTSPVQSPFYTNRPPADSISTVRSYEFDQRSDPYTVSEPRTPSDHPRDRTSYQHSVLTVSDPDPFAAGGIVVPGIQQDLNRLSVWSDSSLLDPHVKRRESMIVDRMSYGSSSSNSHGNPTEPHSHRTHPPSAIRRQPSDSANATTKRRRREASLMADGAFTLNLLAVASAAVQGTNALAPASSTVSPIAVKDAKEDALEPATKPTRRPSARARGMTVATERPGTAGSTSNASHPLRLYRQASESHLRNLSKSTTSTASPIMFSSARSSLSNSSGSTPPLGAASRPLVLVRKASSSRVNLPPLYAAPPSSRLPAPPLSPFTPSDDDADADSFVLPDPVHSSSSSSLSFASVEDIPDEDAMSFLMRDALTDEAPPISPPATVKNMRAELQPRQPASSRTDSTILGSGYPLPPQLLKKAPSQQSMDKRISEVSLLSALSLVSDDMSPTTPSNPSPSSSTKAPRKQRSFHHPRIPLPPLPTLRHAGSYNNNGNADASSSSSKHPPSPASPPAQTRKRLFSSPTMRRTSSGKTSPPSTADDDLRSLSSLNLSIDGGDSASRESLNPSGWAKPLMMSFANMGNHLSLVTDNACIAPAWEELSMGPKPRKVSSQMDYIPQRIMSPAAMLRLEEQLAGEEFGQQSSQAVAQGELERKPKLDLEPGDFGLSFIGGTGRTMSIRSRTDSLQSTMSAATMAFGADKSMSDERSLRGIVGVAQTFSTPGRRPSTAIDARSSLWIGTTVANPTLSTRPSTAQPNLASPPTSPTSLHSVSSDHSNSGLPPPPRTRLSREKQREPGNKRSSVAPMQPLCPPPQRRPSQRLTMNEEEDASVNIPSPQSSRPPSAFGQKAINRRSVMRKPSFLDIDDEWEQDNEDIMDRSSLMDRSINSFVSSRTTDIDVESSFLDLDRGNSFDTIRSFDEDLRIF